MASHRTKGEGTIYFWAGKSLWVGQITLPNGKRWAKYGKSQKVVKEWVLEQRKKLADGVLIYDNKITIEEFVQRWLTDVASYKLRPSTMITHQRIIKNHITPTTGHLRLKDLKPAHLQHLYSEKLASGLSKRTVKYIHIIMHQSLDMAVKWGLVARNVSDATDTPYPDRKPVQPLTKERLRGFSMFCTMTVCTLFMFS